MAEKPLVLAYEGCQTCKKALAWLKAHGVASTVRPIVEEPPTAAELGKWIPKSGRGVRKWLNTSGQSYRALGKAKIDALGDGEVVDLLSRDGKLVKRPVVVTKKRVLVGFDEAGYQELLGELG